VELCYLFGSQADGCADAASDWDIGVAFARTSPPEDPVGRWLDLLEDLEGVFPPGKIDLVFLGKAAPAIQNAAIHGELLYAASDLARADFEEAVMRIWMDLRPFIEAQERDVEASVRGGYLLRGHQAGEAPGRGDPGVGPPSA
jgi:predicted nucleotidyltransferase